MCFSAPASFIASGGLITLGGVSVGVSKKEDRYLAIVPLMFGIQQGFEGVQWLYLGNGSSSLPAGYAFLFFAFIVWPAYVPFFVYQLDPKRRPLFKWFVALGILVSLYFLAVFLTHPLTIDAFRSCVRYSFNPPYRDLANTAYLIAVFGPLLASSRRIFRVFGVIIAVAAIIAWLFFTFAFASVWCFFAAIVSSLFFVYIQYKKEIMQRFAFLR